MFVLSSWFLHYYCISLPPSRVDRDVDSSVSRNLPIGVLPAHFADRESVRVPIPLVEPVRFVVDLVRRVADVLLPMFGPVEVLVAQLFGSFRIAAHDDTVDHAADQRCKAEHQEDHAQYPVNDVRGVKLYSDEDVG